MRLAYRIVDVFTEKPLEGNGLAVFLDGSDLNTPTMQKIAREMNLSETVFLVPPELPDCVARLRIFTPYSEMPFAGHPTIGTSFVLQQTGIAPAGEATFTLQENAGPIRVRADREGALWLTTPPIDKGNAYDPATCAAVLGLTSNDLLANLPCQIYSAGNPFLFVPLRDKATVDRASVDPTALKRLTRDGFPPTGIFVFAPTPEGAYSRMFAPEQGIWEDPATGSGTGPLAAFMMEHNLAPHSDGARFFSEQGAKMGRRSILHVIVHGERGKDAIEVGGHVVPVAEGMLSF